MRNEIRVIGREHRSDREIEQDVDEALRWDTLVNSAHIRVRVVNSVVYLTGTVASAALRSRAVRLSEVAGVSNVDATGVEVARWQSPKGSGTRLNITDSGIRRAIERRLMLDPFVSAAKVEVEVRGGMVTLSGEAATLFSKRSAEDAARTVMGVREIRNQVKVVSQRKYSDLELKSEIERALLRAPFVHSDRINVEVHGGIATLTGVVRMPYEKTRADILTSRIKGVVAIRNRLDVEGLSGPLPSGRHAREAGG